ncbi:acyl-CoA dehydrogenase family protein [Ideonella sp. YS5]|uniref:acyl-CoA dehydrogenase family protein n=1 Tax=Ideonella sp. YS5 TaxID=3453714 RepID=UPI003EEEE94B
MNLVVKPVAPASPAGPEQAASARVERVRQIAREVAGPAAQAVDRDARFPREAIDALKTEQLLSAHVPQRFGGLGLGIAELGQMCEALGQRCASAAMVFAMHQVQVACLVRHGSTPFFEGHLHELVRDQRLIASVTSEAGVGGSVRTSICPVETQPDGSCLVRKEGTVVSYGDAADDLLITVRRHVESVAGDQAMVLARKPQCEMQQAGTWDAMGMRGTCSPGYTITARFGPEQIVPAPFADINAQTMVPWAHILWSSAWLGIATDAVARARAFVRDTGRKMSATPPTAARLSDVSAQLQLMRVQVREWASRYDRMTAAPDGGAQELSSVACAVQLNHLKLASSELVADICAKALRITGTTGYRNDSPYSIARHLRDAHSAALMIGNERIHAANGALQMVYRDEAL